MTNQIIKKGKNKVGTTYTLSKLPNGSFGVYILKENYAGHVRGGIAKTWCYCEKNMLESDAVKLFEKKLNGKAK